MVCSLIVPPKLPAATRSATVLKASRSHVKCQNRLVTRQRHHAVTWLRLVPLSQTQPRPGRRDCAESQSQQCDMSKSPGNSPAASRGHMATAGPSFPNTAAPGNYQAAHRRMGCSAPNRTKSHHRKFMTFTPKEKSEHLSMNPSPGLRPAYDIQKPDVGKQKEGRKTLTPNLKPVIDWRSPPRSWPRCASNHQSAPQIWRWRDVRSLLR